MTVAKATTPDLSQGQNKAKKQEPELMYMLLAKGGNGEGKENGKENGGGSDSGGNSGNNKELHIQKMEKRLIGGWLNF